MYETQLSIRYHKLELTTEIYKLYDLSIRKKLETFCGNVNSSYYFRCPQNKCNFLLFIYINFIRSEYKCKIISIGDFILKNEC